jgi:hypothetical protein
MILEITGLERGTMDSKAGKTLTGLTVTGIKLGRDGEPGEEYEKFLMDWKNADEIAVLEEAGVAATVGMYSVKDGNFWNLDKVEIIDGDGAPSKGTDQPAKTPDKGHAHASPETPAVYAPKEEVISFATTEEGCRATALAQAVSFTDALLSSDERFKSLMPVSKTNVEIVTQMTLETASKFESFITGKKAGSDVVSDDADLDKDGVDAEEPSLPGDEA